jgi:hypothetical protein
MCISRTRIIDSYNTDSEEEAIAPFSPSLKYAPVTTVVPMSTLLSVNDGWLTVMLFPVITLDL